MRQIKFRGKRIDNGVWVYGNLIILPDKALIAVHTGNDNSLGEHTYKTYAVDPATVGQFTGCTAQRTLVAVWDEIYEGDICSVTIFRFNQHQSYYECSVECFDGCFYFVNKEKGVFISFGNIYGLGIEVIGNIHEYDKIKYGDQLGR